VLPGSRYARIVMIAVIVIVIVGLIASAVVSPVAV
jgi:hypothetical protein